MLPEATKAATRPKNRGFETPHAQTRHELAVLRVAHGHDARAALRGPPAPGAVRGDPHGGHLLVVGIGDWAPSSTNPGWSDDRRVTGDEA